MRWLSQKRLLRLASVLLAVLAFLLGAFWINRGLRPVIDCELLDAFGRANWWSTAIACLDRIEYDALFSVITLLFSIVIAAASFNAPDTPIGGDKSASSQQEAIGRASVSEGKAQGFVIRIIDAWCYLEPPASKSDDPVNPHVLAEVLDWSRLFPRFATIPLTPARYCKLLLSLTNREPEPVFIKQLGVVIMDRGVEEWGYLGVRKLLSSRFHIPSYPDRHLQLRSYDSGEPISFERLMKIDSGEKWLWVLYIRLPDPDAADTLRIYFEGAGIRVLSDIGPHWIEAHVPTNGSAIEGTDIRWERLSMDVVKEMEDIFDPD